jgi:23S rRNA (cytidine1920-2'-O)/16S rRNA (cytidine1409-2'-O)-methyltransferase
MSKKVRVDVLLVERGLAESRSQAQRLVMAGQVRADGQVVPKPATMVPRGAALQVETGPRFVSRGGDKLQAAFDAFALEVTDLVCADVGASTGGFTDCLLQHGAALVYALDVGQGILHWKLRQHPRVVLMENTNARHVERLPEPVGFITMDASFISLKVLLPVVMGWFSQPTPEGQSTRPDAEAREDVVGPAQVIALIKPQFEAGRREVARGKGVVRDPQLHRQVLIDVLSFAQERGYTILGLIRSPVLGSKGNVEFLAWLGWPGQARVDWLPWIDQLIPQDTSS